MWTERKIARLKKLLDDGNTAAEIAEKLGVTRNAVIGKTHRAGFQFNHENMYLGRGLRQKIEALCNSERNLTAEEVSARVGCSRCYVYKLNYEINLPLQIKHYELRA